VTRADRVPAADRYGPTARVLHWLVAALAAVVVALGWAAVAAPHNSSERSGLLLVHRSVGLTILVLMTLRALWRWRHPPPPLPATVGAVVTRLAPLTHFALYLIFITMPLAGYVNSAAAGHDVSVFGLFSIPSLVPRNERLAQWAIAVHLAGQYGIYLLVSLHVAGALYHGAIRRDGVFERMLPLPHSSPRPS
jgi:cytochrome b561